MEVPPGLVAALYLSSEGNALFLRTHTARTSARHDECVSTNQLFPTFFSRYFNSRVSDGASVGISYVIHNLSE